MSRYEANPLARAWLSVAQASGSKDDTPALAKTVHLEQHPDGVRLVALDRYMLLTAWVPDSDDPDAPPPGLDVLPDRQVVAADPYGRAKNLAGYVLALTGSEDEDTWPRLSMDVVYDVRLDEDEAAEPHLEGLDPTYVRLDVPDTETVYLTVVEADFPNWRKLVWEHDPQTTAAVALNPEILERLSKLRRWCPGSPLVWRWGGPEKVAAIEFGRSEPYVSGLVMPMRWTLPGEPEPDQDGEGPGEDDEAA